MLIGINATAAFKQPRTGVEEYVFQLIKSLAELPQAKKQRFVLYSPEPSRLRRLLRDKSDNFLLKRLRWPRLPLWTQVRLSIEMASHKPDALLVPAHILPRIHPDNSVAVVHGVEYERYPECYPKYHLRYLRWGTQYALKHARQVIASSGSTKRDLVNLYGGNPDKIRVVYLGFAAPKPVSEKHGDSAPFFLYLGRIEAKKNVYGIIRAFELFKEKYRMSYKLVLAGASGYGYGMIRQAVRSARCQRDIVVRGYVPENEKWQLLQRARAFVFPSFYEGFGIPILEAQSMKCPLITSDISSMPEVAGEGAVFVNPKSVEEICESMYKVISDESFKNSLIKKGIENTRRFSWGKCARETLGVLENKMPSSQEREGGFGL